MSPFPLLPGAPAGLALGLVILYLSRALGGRRTIAYLLAVAAYGWTRARTIRWLSDHELAVPFPYLMEPPRFALGGTSLFELCGWALAVPLSAWAGARLLRASGAPATPHRVAALGAVGMAAVCFAVETAAAAGGWWLWTIPLPAGGWPRVPWIAFVDWGFVAFDFLLPALLFATASSWTSRLLALGVFPLHMWAHAQNAPLFALLPWTGHDLVHTALLAYVLVRAIGEEPSATLPADAVAALPLAPAGAAVLVALTCAITVFREHHRLLPALAAIAPLAALVGLALALPARSPGPAPSGAAVLRRRVAAGVLVVVAVLGWRLESRWREADYVAAMRTGADALNRGDASAAATAFQSGVALRPGAPGGRTLLATALLRAGRRAEARRELEQALGLGPTWPDALSLLATLDLVEGRPASAGAHARLGRRVHPARADFAYLAAAAEHDLAHGRPVAIDLARQAGPGALGSLERLARGLGDAETADACRALIAGSARPSR